MKGKKIAMIGCGNLGSALVNGLLASNALPPTSIIATKRHIGTLRSLLETGVVVSADNVQAVHDADIVILGLKPYNILQVLEELGPHLDPKRHILISLATGVSMDALQKAAGVAVPLFRAMPNTAADVGASLTCVCTTSSDENAIAMVKSIFDTIGITIMIDEELMGAATVLGACGIAYALRFIRAMVQGGIEIGFDAHTASRIVNQTVKGAVGLLMEKGLHPEAEIDKVTTPKGCTIVGLNEMEHNGFSSSLIKGIATSYKKIGG